VGAKRGWFRSLRVFAEIRQKTVLFDFENQFASALEATPQRFLGAEKKRIHKLSASNNYNE